MYDTQDKGDHAELRVASACKRLGLTVLVPYSENLPYDLVVERSDSFERIQVKSSVYESPSIRFHCYCSNSSKSGNNRTDYSETNVDYLATYSARTDHCYVVPVDVAPRNAMRLNVEDADPKHDASAYRIDRVLGDA